MLSIIIIRCGLSCANGMELHIGYSEQKNKRGNGIAKTGELTDGTNLMNALLEWT